jgi:hypothetical protein
VYYSLLERKLNKLKHKTHELLYPSKEVGLEYKRTGNEVHIFVCHHQNAGQNHNMNIANNSFENAENVKCFGTIIAYKNYILREIKIRLNLGSACYHSVQNILSPHILSKSLQIKICGTIILPVYCLGVNIGLSP